MKTPMTKLMLAAVAATLLCLGAMALEQDPNGCYMLGSVQDWKDFAYIVENTDQSANAKMMADIDLGDDQTRIGYNKEFKGVFDGCGLTLTIKYDGTYHKVAPFASVNGATLKNLHVSGTIKSTQNQPSCLIGGSVGTTIVSNIWGDVEITSTGTSWVEAGAIVGLVYQGTLIMTDCLFTGSITSPSSYNGCFVGWTDSINSGTTTLTNCLSTGMFTYTSSSGIAIRGNHSNCYVKQFPTSFPNGVTQPTDVQLADGTTATALQAGREETVWVQGEDGPMLALFAKGKMTITWLDSDNTLLGNTEVFEDSMPTHADLPDKSDTPPYKQVFVGWTPELEPVVSNTTYTATFRTIADLALVESDWTAADGDTITGETTHKVTIPGGATVTINGIEVAGGGGGAANPLPSFAAGGKAATTEFVQGAGGKWTLTTFAELSNDAVGADVAAEQIKVYAADTVEGLESASPMASGVTVKEKKSAVKTTIEVTPPPAAPAQFFKVEFGE